MEDYQNQPKFDEALEVAKQLTQKSDEALFEQLGLRIQDIQNVDGYKRAQFYMADYRHEAEDLLGTEDLKRIGMLWWKKLEPQLIEIVCDKNNQDLKQITSNQTIPQVVAFLVTSTLLAALGPPSWIIVLASILATKIAESGLDSVCEVWQESLTNPKETSG